MPVALDEATETAALVNPAVCNALSMLLAVWVGSPLLKLIAAVVVAPTSNSNWPVTMAEEATSPEMLNESAVAVVELLATVLVETVCPSTEMELICGAGGLT